MSGNLSAGADASVAGGLTVGGSLTANGTTTLAGPVSSGSALSLGSAGRLPAPRTYVATNWSSIPNWYRLGTWVAGQGGRALKLNVVACGNGYNANNHGNGVGSPSVFDLDIYVNTSNGVDFVANGCYAYGWAVSRHVLWPCTGVGMSFTPGNLSSSASYNFYVYLGAYPGEILVTATTNATWTTNTGGPFAVIPDAQWIPLHIASEQTSKTVASAYGTYIRG